MKIRYSFLMLCGFISQGLLAVETPAGIPQTSAHKMNTNLSGTTRTEVTPENRAQKTFDSEAERKNICKADPLGSACMPPSGQPL